MDNLNNQIEIAEYGPVLILSGNFTGQMGLYDDDHGSKLIVYPWRSGGYILLLKKQVRPISQGDEFHSFVFENTMGYAVMKNLRRMEKKRVLING